MNIKTPLQFNFVKFNFVFILFEKTDWLKAIEKIEKINDLRISFFNEKYLC